METSPQLPTGASPATGYDLQFEKLIRALRTRLERVAVLAVALWAEMTVARTGGFVGMVRPSQRAASRVLDVANAEAGS